MRTAFLVLSIACTGIAPLPPVDLSLRIAAVPPVVRSGEAGRVDVTPVNSGDAVRKHKLTGHVTLVRVMAQRGGLGTNDLQFAPGRGDGFVCTGVPFGLNCYTDGTFGPGPGPRIPLTARAKAAGDYRVCAEISAEGRTERTPGDNRACAAVTWIPPDDTQVDE